MKIVLCFAHRMGPGWRRGVGLNDTRIVNDIGHLVQRSKAFPDEKEISIDIQVS